MIVTLLALGFAAACLGLGFLSACVAFAAPSSPERLAPGLPAVTDHDLFQSMRQRLAEGQPLERADLDYWADRFRARCIRYWSGHTFEQYLAAPYAAEQAALEEQRRAAFSTVEARTPVVREGVLAALAIARN